MIPIVVPAQVHDVPRVVNQVQIVPGTNWDFSRTAQVTPITPLPDPEPTVAPAPAAAPATPPALAPYQVADGIPDAPPDLQLGFSANSAALPKAKRQLLAKLPKDRAWLVVAYPQAGDADAVRVCKARARVVAALLRASGHQVTGIKALALDKSFSNEALIKVQSVQLFALPVGA